jgi:uncharacterized protein (DUF849 family)
MSMIRRIKVCLNGGRHRHEHPAVPLTPGESAVFAAAAVAAGAEAVHLHPRDTAGNESLSPGAVGPTVRAVRRFASVNVSEPGWADLAEILHRAGIAVEAGCGPSRTPRRWPPRPRSCRGC